eukprot:s2112_g22.t1
MTARGGNKERTAINTQVPKVPKVSKDRSKASVPIASRVSEKGGETKRLRKDAADAGAFWHSMDTEPGAWIDVLKENGELELPDLSESKHLANKAPQIMKLTGASQLLLKEKRILVHGGSAFKSRVAKYVNIILNKVVPEDYADNDFLRVYVSEHFAEGLAEDSVVEVEQAEGVIVVIEKPSPQKSSHKSMALLPGDLVEVETQPGVWGSMAKVMQATETSLTIRHSHDQREEEIVLSRVRRARSIAIFGPRRLAAAMKIVAAFEEESIGALGALHDNPYFQGQRLGVISEELPVKADVVQRLQKSPFLKQIMLATGSSIRFFMKPAGTEAGKSRKRSVPCVLAGGSLEERWRGLQGVKIIALGMEEKRHPTLPPALLGDARRVSIPNDMVSVVVGKRMESLLELMKSTNTVIVPLREKAEDKDMLFEMILEDTGSEQKTCEIAILGEPSAQALAEVKVRSIVEKHHPGFAEKDMNFNNQAAAGFGVETMLLESELELIESRIDLAKQLTGATGCSVEIAASRAFIAGMKTARALCQEYICWVNNGLQSHVPGLKRPDTVIRCKVDPELMDLPWLQQQLARLAIEKSTVVFWDIEEGDTSRRLIFAGTVIAVSPGVVAGLLDKADALISKAGEYKEKKLSFEECCEADKAARKEQAKEVQGLFQSNRFQEAWWEQHR